MSRKAPFRVFVTGTDTGVGKTEAAAALLSLLADRGLRPAPFKPYESGMRSLDAPQDALVLKEAARSDDDLAVISVHRYRAPLAPGVAAHRLGRTSKFVSTLAAYARFEGRTLVAEGAGGLRVPIDARRDVIDLVDALGLPVLLVARAGLGTLNHTALSLDALAVRKIQVVAVLLSRSTPARDASEKDNASQLAKRHRVRVLGPVRFERDPIRRRAAFRAALAPLITNGG